MHKLLLAPLALIALLLGLLAPASPATAADSAWNDGKSDADTIYNCITESPSTGVSANVGWFSPSGEVPKIGETFMMRGYIGLVGLPCSGKVALIPELMAPAGIEYVDQPVTWDIYASGESPDLTSGGLDYFNGVNGGAVITLAGDEPFVLRQGETLEFQYPVRATRELKGPATQRPECQDRLDGVAPCPVAQSGDHFQIAFAVGGHGGDKSYVTPYVGMFAGNGGGGNGGGDPQVKVASTTTASYQLRAGKPGKAVVTVKASKVPTGTVKVLDKGRAIASATMVAGDRGKLALTLPKMKKGVHNLVVKYLGSASVKPSASSSRTVRLR